MWPPSWWGVLRWCVAHLLVGRAALGCDVLCCVVLCCVWWCLAPRMVGRAALVCGPPHRGVCCGGVWPPPWWGVLCRCVRVLVRGVLAVLLLGLFCWFVVVSATLRPALLGVCCICLTRTDGPASRARVVRHPFVLAGTEHWSVCTALECQRTPGAFLASMEILLPIKMNLHMSTWPHMHQSPQTGFLPSRVV